MTQVQTFEKNITFYFVHDFFETLFRVAVSPAPLSHLHLEGGAVQREERITVGNVVVEGPGWNKCDL